MFLRSSGIFQKYSATQRLLRPLFKRGQNRRSPAHSIFTMVIPTGTINAHLLSVHHHWKNYPHPSLANFTDRVLRFPINEKVLSSTSKFTITMVNFRWYPNYNTITHYSCVIHGPYIKISVEFSCSTQHNLNNRLALALAFFRISFAESVIVTLTR